MERTRADMLLEIADDELILGWRDSEWTGIAPFLEEDVAFSSFAQGEIGHARALYELAAGELGTDADALASSPRSGSSAPPRSGSWRKSGAPACARSWAASPSSRSGATTTPTSSRR